MADASGARFRMRYSFESRLRAVRLVAAGMSIAEAARRQGASRSTVHRWWRRYSAEGAAGLRERSSRPHRSQRRLAVPAEAEIAALRLATGAGPVALGAALLGPACFDRRQGAAAARPLAHAVGAGAGAGLRALRAGSARASCCTSTSRS